MVFLEFKKPKTAIVVSNVFSARARNPFTLSKFQCKSVTSNCSKNNYFINIYYVDQHNSVSLLDLQSHIQLYNYNERRRYKIMTHLNRMLEVQRKYKSDAY